MNESIKEFIEVLMQPMALFGIAGQALFASRFLVQWIVSERRRESSIPIAFWYLSLVGGSLTLIYAIWRRDPIITIGQTTGLLIYSRNLILIHRRQGRTQN